MSLRAYAILVIGSFLIAAVVAFYTPAAHGAECRGVTGIASYYGTESGSVTANGERFSGSGMTAASRTLPFGTKLRVTYAGRSVVVRINDRGPYIKGRFLDLSRAAAERLGMVHVGVAKVCAELLS